MPSGGLPLPATTSGGASLDPRFGPSSSSKPLSCMASRLSATASPAVVCTFLAFLLTFLPTAFSATTCWISFTKSLRKRLKDSWVSCAESCAAIDSALRSRLIMERFSWTRSWVPSRSFEFTWELPSRSSFWARLAARSVAVSRPKVDAVSESNEACISSWSRCPNSCTSFWATWVSWNSSEMISASMPSVSAS